MFFYCDSSWTLSLLTFHLRVPFLILPVQKCRALSQTWSPLASVETEASLPLCWLFPFQSFHQKGCTLPVFDMLCSGLRPRSLLQFASRSCGANVTQFQARSPRIVGVQWCADCWRGSYTRASLTPRINLKVVLAIILGSSMGLVFLRFINIVSAYLLRCSPLRYGIYTNT